MRFGSWCERSHVPPTVEAITRVIAGRYATEAVREGIDPATWNKHCSALSGYWRWLNKRAGIEGNPWSGQRRSKAAARNGEKAKRPFTDGEVRTLLQGNADRELHDAMRVAGLSGMRLEEIYRLKVADCAYGIFNIRQAKSAAGVRVVPIHSALVEIVDRRTEGQPATAYLFPEAGPARPGRERSMAISKKFGRYRIGLGVEDRDEGKRHSKVDFHSWRRTFITKARNAGIDQATVAKVVGHVAGNITDDVYNGGAELAMRRACVEAVRLP
jgi:integrase